MTVRPNNILETNDSSLPSANLSLSLEVPLEILSPPNKRLRLSLKGQRFLGSINHSNSKKGTDHSKYKYILYYSSTLMWSTLYSYFLTNFKLVHIIVYNNHSFSYQSLFFFQNMFAINYSSTYFQRNFSSQIS